MILRNVTARHGRRCLTPVTKTTLRQLTTTESTTTTKTAEPTITKRQTSDVRVFGADPSSERAGARWTTTRPVREGGAALTPAQQFAEFQRIQSNTKKIGSEVERRYVPTELIRNPPGPEDVTLEMLMASQTHMGHNTSSWNPANSRYIYGSRHGVHIISLETTAAHLRRAARVVEEVSYRGGLILFVGTRKMQMEIVARAAELSGACHLFTRWTPGSITNRDVLLKSRSTKMVNETDRKLDDFDKYTGTSRPLVPDLVVCLNPLENYTLLYECGLTNVPTIGIIDTDADPSWVTYTIPANDDSLRSVAVIGGVLGRAGQKGRQRRLADAAKGEVTWQTTAEVQSYMQSELAEVMQRRKEVMGRYQEQLAGFNEDESALLSSRLKSGPTEVGHEDMVAMMGEAAKEETKAQAQEVVKEMKNDGLGEEAVDAMLKETKFQEPKVEKDETAATLDSVVDETTKAAPTTPAQPGKK
ncbi:ribosomal protein s2 domain-containing protein [Sarocladium implicatum]|nr:ribosomal protein s2 domain-containing protein [Sarocladium implicatum]